VTTAAKIKRKCVALALDMLDMLIGYEPDVITPEEALLHSDVLLRWGDGESSLAIGRSTSFQQASPELARELRSLLRKRGSGTTLCFPGFLLRRVPFSGSDDRFRRIWLLTAILMRIWARHGHYGDAFMFRREGHMGGLNALSNLIADAQRIALLSADPADTETLRSMQTKAVVQHVRVPGQDAYSARDQILRSLLQIERPDILLLSAGPTGKCLAPELFRTWGKGIKIIDTGHLFLHLAEGRQSA
jgi:hypothetical protein